GRDAARARRVPRLGARAPASRPRAALLLTACLGWGLERLDVRRRRALLALRHVEGDLLAFLQPLIAGALDGAVMGEQLLAPAVRRDEAEALGVVEPLHGACSHVIPSLELQLERGAVRVPQRAR